MTAILQLLRITGKQWRWMALGILLTALVILANTMLMALSGWFIASMAMAGVTGVPFNYFSPSGGIRFLAIVRTVGRYVERLVTHDAAFRSIAVLRTWLYGKIEPLAPAGLEHYAGGDVAGRLRKDVDALEGMYLRILAPLAGGTLAIVSAIVFLIWYSSFIAAALLVLLVVSGVLLPMLVGRLSEEPGRRSAAGAADLRIQVGEGLRGSEELLLLGAVERQTAVVEDLSSRLIVEQERLGRINGLGGGGMVFTTGCAAVLVLLIGSTQLQRGDISPPSLVMLLLFSAALFEAVAQFPSALHLLSFIRESAERVMELADSPVPVPGPGSPAPPPFSFDISFRAVSGGYSPGCPVLHDFSLDIPAGGAVALAGMSGSGKSLLFQIMLRFREYEGHIAIGGVELRTLDRDALAGVIAAVPQHPHLFNASIRDNILLDDESVDEHDLHEVLVTSGLAGWVEGLPLGLATQVGLNGAEVSGGEARRIALARALVRKTPILILDEPTEGLDAATERMMVERLRERTRDVTLLVISHRPACMELGEKVVRLNSPA